MYEALNLTGTRCLLTGATGALGGAVARLLYARGADLVLTGRSSSALSRLADELAPLGSGAVATIPVDLAAPDAADFLSNQLGGRLDVLINNAAIQGPIGPFATTNRNEWETALQFDLVGPISLTHAVLGLLHRNRPANTRRRKIIFVSGGGATGPRPNFTAYAVAKTGLVRFAECLAHEIRESGIDVNAIAPGPMPSAMTQSILAAGSASAIGAEHATAQKALGAEGQATLVRAAELVGYLAAPASDGITGRLISAVWDPWPDLAQHRDALASSDIFTLRRIVPSDRGQNWE